MATMVARPVDDCATCSEDDNSLQRIRRAPSSGACGSSGKTSRKLDFSSGNSGLPSSSRRQHVPSGVGTPRSGNGPATPRSRLSVPSSPRLSGHSTHRQPLTPRGRTSVLVPKLATAPRTGPAQFAALSANDPPASHSLDTGRSRRAVNAASVSPATPRDGRGRPIGLAAIGSLSCPPTPRTLQADGEMRTPRHHQPAGNSSTSSASEKSSNSKDSNALSIKGRLLSVKVPASPRAAARPRSQLSQRSRAPPSVSSHSSGSDKLILGTVAESILSNKDKDSRMPPELHLISAVSRAGQASALPSSRAPEAQQVALTPVRDQHKEIAHKSEALDDDTSETKPASASQPSRLHINASCTANDVAQAHDGGPSLSTTCADFSRIGGLPVASAEQQPQLAGNLVLRLQGPGARDSEPATPWAARKATDFEPLTPSPAPQGRPPTSPATHQWPITPAKALQVGPLSRAHSAVSALC